MVTPRSVVLATGGDPTRAACWRSRARTCPTSSHYFEEPAPLLPARLLVVGGRNSAVEAALRCWHAGREVTLSYRGDAFEPTT